ncbi:hypothetical protein YC2023_086910 [Brassica napus]
MLAWLTRFRLKLKNLNFLSRLYPQKQSLSNKVSSFSFSNLPWRILKNPTNSSSYNHRDIAAKIVAFTHQGRPLEYCILSASGAVSIAVLRHSDDPNNPTGVVTAYMISGSFLNTERTRYSGSTDQMYHLRLWPGTNTLSKQMVRGSTSLDLLLYSFSPSELSSSR